MRAAAAARRSNQLVRRPRYVNCHRRPRPDENPDDEWRAHSDGVGELHVFCPECARREFAADAPARFESNS